MNKKPTQYYIGLIDSLINSPTAELNIYQVEALDELKQHLMSHTVEPEVESIYDYI